MVIRAARTRDGRWRVYIHHDQTAELIDDHGRCITGRMLIHELGRRLADLGVTGDDLIQE